MNANEARIGVYICHCGINIAATVDVEAVTELASQLPNVVVARNYAYVCSDPGQELIKKDIEELNLNRVIVASCSPRMHEPTFRGTVQEAGLNPYCFEMANIREQCSWVHGDRGQATQKAKDLIAASVARASLLEPLEEEEIDVIPKALVIGGGVAGMQAAMDTADAGFQVYLVEKEPSIGGHMAQLDKTFPTLDCSQCILTPKMVDVDRHPNIELLTYSEVTEVEGYIGNFKVKVKKKPRYVDEEKCTACGDCVKECPVEVPSEFDVQTGKRKAIYLPFPQAVPSVFTIDRRGVPACRNACPIGQYAQGYIGLISQGKFKEALALIKQENPFPAICGRVCPHPCEAECKRKDVDEPLAIASLKRFVADHELKLKEEIPVTVEEKKEEKVAIIGSGPSGLTCAHDLAKLGYEVTVFEALPVAGGMLAVGIPDYRLPKNILEVEIEAIKKLGVEVRTNTPVDERLTLDDLKGQGYEAICIAVGAHRSQKLGIAGEDLEGVIHGVDFLRDVNLKKEAKLGNKVAVIGGGNVAMDSVRTALRLGAEEAFVVYRRSRAEMPASPEELEEAEDEGVKINFLAAPTEILGQNGRVHALKCIRMELGEPDETGRRRPMPIPGSEFTLDVDNVIAAIGQAPEVSFLKDQIGITRVGTIEVDPVTLETGREGVFASGDAVSGPATVVEAIAAGHETAISIDRYLKGEDLREGRIKEEMVMKVAEPEIPKDIERKPRAKMPAMPKDARITSFEEVNLGFSEKQAVEEALRCLSCAVCIECRECEKVCEPEAINYEMEEEHVELDVGTIIVAAGFDQFDASLKPEYGYDLYDRVITGLEFERLSSASGPTLGKIVINGKEPKDVVFIQCVGSRDSSIGNEYCSRVCCMYTAKQAHLIKEKIPDARITVFYMDVRAFGKGFEEFYDRVRREGINYRRGNPSEVYKRGDKLVVSAEDTILGEPMEAEADLVVLATGMVPRATTKEIASLLKLSESSDRFLLEAHPKLRPLDTATGGIFLAGCCQGPKDIPDAVAQASGAAAKALALMSRGRVKLEAFTAMVDEDICSGCGVCVSICPFEAVALSSEDERKLATITLAQCQGCGSCSAACPSGAISMNHFKDEQILAQIDALAEELATTG